MLKILELFENLKIKVSDTGEIYTTDHNYKRINGRVDNRRGKCLKPKINKYGYKTIVLTKNGIRKNYAVHRLVAMAYIPNPQNKPTINHKDGNKLNNNINNLEWATHAEQKAHSIKNGLCIKNLLSLQEASKKRSIPIVFNGVKYNSIKEASRKTRRSESFIKKYGERYI